ncbi:MAG: fatty acid desaturase CarF family protein [Bacteroidota bacterium]
MTTKNFPTAFDLISSIAFLFLEVLLVHKIWNALANYNQLGIEVLTFLLIIPLGFIVSDLISGLVHYLADNFGNSDTPIFGSTFIEPFRSHHDDPGDILKHNFFVTNGNTFFIVAIGLVPGIFLFPTSSLVWIDLNIFWLILSILTAFTNQFHKWAHHPSPHKLVKLLQKSGLIISPKNHNIHHQATTDKYYCITCGWLNAILHKTQFFQRILPIEKEENAEST